MFTTKKLFSGIPCPHIEGCLLPNCIFAHALVRTKEATNSSLSEAGSRAVSVEEKEVPRKRRRLNDHATHSYDHDGAGGTVRSQKDDREIVQAQKSKPQKHLNSAIRSISPPPLRKATTPDAMNQTKSPRSNHRNVPSNTAPCVFNSGKKTPAKHVENETLNPRILQNAPASHEMRYKLLKAFHDQLLRLNNELVKDANDEEKQLVLSDQELIVMALDLEENAAEMPNIYSNVAKNKIMALKKTSRRAWIDERAAARKAAAGIASDVAAKMTTSIRPLESAKSLESGLSQQAELVLLSKLYTPIKNLTAFNYVTSIPTDAEIAAAKAGVEAARGYELCDRCNTRFQVFPGRREDGVLATGGKCTYHYGKAYFPDRSQHDQTRREKRYRCCGQVLGESSGCSQAENHVFKISDAKRLASILNFASIPIHEESRETKTPVCIDGEMSYTVFGLELVRLTATTWPDNEELIDVLVRPVGEILDFNSRYSGVWPSDMADAMPYIPGTSSTAEIDPVSQVRKLRIVSSPAEARDLLFGFLTPSTPIIGHGLENDLNATRIVHPTLIDTSLLYPHKAGLPYRNGLKALVARHLGKHIQVVVDGKMEGHDSKEDANAAGDLVKYRLIKEWEDMKMQGWICQHDIFIGPKAEWVKDFREFPVERGVRAN